MACLSVFIDEASNFGRFEPANAFYVLTLVLHDQSKSIFDTIAKLTASLNETKHPSDKAIHTGPLIRRNEYYSNQTIDERRMVFFRLLAFLRKSDVSYQSFIFPKKEYDALELVGRISRELSLFIRENIAYFQSFDNVIVYYDGGQPEISRILASVFNALLFEVEFRKVSPAEYYLFQAADLICTVELLAVKRIEKKLTRSDTGFFYKPKELQRIIKEVRAKSFDKINRL